MGCSLRSPLSKYIARSARLLIEILIENKVLLLLLVYLIKALAFLITSLRKHLNNKQRPCCFLLDSLNKSLIEHLMEHLIEHLIEHLLELIKLINSYTNS